MNRLPLALALGCVLLASHAEAARWKVGTGPAGAQTRATYPSGTCYWDTTDTGPDQCRYKALSATSCQFVQEAGANQCTPTSTTPPAPVKTEWARLEGTGAHVYSYDGAMQFDDYLYSSGAKTLVWKQGTDAVSIVLTSAGMTVTRNGATVRTSTTVTPTDAQMQAIATMLRNSVAVTRFRLNTAAKLAAANARLVTVTPGTSNAARGVELAFFEANALVSGLMGDKAAYDRWRNDPAPGGNRDTQRDCVTDYEAAAYRYNVMYDECLRRPQKEPDLDSWFSPGDFVCAVEFGVRADGAMLQLFRCMLGG